MAHRVVQAVLGAVTVLVFAMWLQYHAHGWPLGKTGLEVLVSLVLTATALAAVSRVSPQPSSWEERGERIGLCIGLLWTAEIGMNNVLTPGLPLRDILDNAFWALVALLILGWSIYAAYSTHRFKAGVVVGLRMGLASGAIASLTALVLVVFGMDLLIHDPLNVAEWAAQGAASGEPSMQVYFAYETLAGAMLHLVVLGVVMGGLLGVLGGAAGAGARWGRPRQARLG